MTRVLALWLLTMTACAIDPSADPSDVPTDEATIGIKQALPGDPAGASRFLARTIDCMKQMRVSGVGPYSVQCAVGYFVTDPGVQIAYTATDAAGATWMAARAAAPRSADESGDGFAVFPLESPGAPAMGSLTVRAHLVDALGATSNELTETVLVSP